MPFPDAKYPPPPHASMPRTAWTVTVCFCVLARDLSEARRIVMSSLPDPSATFHDPIDSWALVDESEVDS